jgi:hypothetical protein
MPLLEHDQSAAEVERCFEQSYETSARLEDLWEMSATVFSAVVLFAGLGYVAYESAQMPVTVPNAALSLAFIGVVAYVSLNFADYVLCLITENHECRACQRETARWTPGEDHRTPYERATDRTADSLAKLTDPNPDRADWNPPSVAARRGGDDEE